VALSDGYLGVASWSLDLLARWYERAREADIVPEGFLTAERPADLMTGVVLIDEIDLYLHPRWQRDIIGKVRGTFPRMTFVVTTHNPLTLLGARPGEIQIVRRGAGGDIEFTQRDIPPGLRMDAVLTGSWFGVASTLDPKTLRDLDRYRQLLHASLSSPEVRAEREALERELSEALDMDTVSLREELDRAGPAPPPLSQQQREAAALQYLQSMGVEPDAEDA
jgi:hypothetical protein